ncbi:hypothetical protein PBAL39_06756 [Pedobacter sp. BAL39]|nr:hypothetical protein PBAL39_06756 [Pedobacter sp. BAL39]
MDKLQNMPGGDAQGNFTVGFTFGLIVTKVTHWKL